MNKARVLGFAILGLAVWESAKSIALTRSRIQERDLQAMRETLEKVSLPILAHRSWMAPNLRSWFPQTAQAQVFAHPDPQALTEFWTIGHRSDPESLEVSQPAQLQEIVAHGALVARRWRKPGATSTQVNLGPSAVEFVDLEARVDQGPCKIKTRSPLHIQCPDQSSLRWEISEINYKPRACLAYRGSQLGAMTISFKLAHPKRAQAIRGHVGFSDFNARLRSDAALQVTLLEHEQVRLNQPFTDAQGWAAFSVPLAQATSTYHLKLQLNANQTQSAPISRPIIPCTQLSVLLSNEAP